MNKYIIFFCYLFSILHLKADSTLTQSLSNLSQDEGILVDYQRKNLQSLETKGEQFLPMHVGNLKPPKLHSKDCFKIPDHNVQFLGIGDAALSLLYSPLRGWFVYDGVMSSIIDRHFIHHSLKEWRTITTAKLASIFERERSDLLFVVRKNTNYFSLENVKGRIKGGNLTYCPGCVPEKMCLLLAPMAVFAFLGYFLGSYLCNCPAETFSWQWGGLIIGVLIGAIFPFIIVLSNIITCVRSDSVIENPSPGNDEEA